MTETQANGVDALRRELSDLRQQVGQLTDRQQIVDCLHRYTRGLDRLDTIVLGSAYFDDARDQHGGFSGSPRQFVEWVTGVMQEWDTSVHFLDLNNLTISGDVAHSECYVLFTQRRVDGEGLDFGGARYLDRLERRDGEWRIAARKLVTDWTARAAVVTFADVPEHPTGSRSSDDPSYSWSSDSASL